MGELSSGETKASLPLCVLIQRRVEILGVKFRPGFIEENQLSIASLKGQETGETTLTRGPNEEVNFRGLRG